MRKLFFLLILVGPAVAVFAADLAGRQPERVKKMASTLAAWKESVEKSLGGADYPAPLK